MTAKTAAAGPGPKQQLYLQFAEMAKALGHAHRLEILELLAQGERSVESLAERGGLTIGNASQHLRLMRQAGLLVSRRDGKRILYRLSDPAVLDLTGALHRLAERNMGEVKSVLAGYFNKRDSMEPVSRKELSRRLRDGLVTVLDVRPPDEFAAGHLPNAINIPLRDLTRRVSTLPKKQGVVAYCRGPYCVLAFEAVAMLRSRGFEARRLEDGYPQWEAAGLPVER
jgi:rhodanese-related sulfurtransferase/DNA-binding transcriptional ArsR family regulator